MSHDKVTVDEPLISTDVDSLIRTLAERKKVALNELRKSVKIDKKTLDKWIAVLEDEGYIVVEYGLGGTNILWRELEEVPASEKTYRTQGQVSQIQPKEAEQPVQAAAPAMPEEPAHAEAPKAENEEFEGVNPLDDEPEPEELLSEYLTRKKLGSNEDDSIKSQILTKMQQDETPETTQIAQEEPAKEEAKEEEAPAVETEEANDEPQAEEAPTEEPPTYTMSKPTQTIRPTQKGVGAADVRELMGSYLSEINKEKAKIESLKKERESLYRDKFATVEGKMQADIVVLTEKILEKQSRIAELKEEVLELPDKVDELDKLQTQMEALKKEGREALSRTRKKADEFIVSVGESKSEVESKIADADKEISAQSDKLKELEKISGSLDVRNQKLKASLDEAKSNIEQLNEAMTTLLDDLQQVEGMKEDIDKLTDSIKHTVAGRGEDLESLERELDGISSVEHWVQEYIRDYEQKIDDIEHYVAKSEDELSDLKEAAESLYLKKYLGELEGMTDAYENELQDSVSHEKDIESKISESRSRITQLVEESQGMIKKLKSDAPDNAGDYTSLVARVKARTIKAKTVIEEKKAERSKLLEDAKKTRKTVRPVASKSQPKKPAKSSSKKKRK